MRWNLFAFVVLSVLLGCLRPANADSSTAHTVSVAVLALESDDAEDQAEALTGALRSRVRTSQGWSLIDTTQSLGMLTAALRCPTKPLSADCEQRIAEQIKSERYIFGYVSKGPAGQVTAEVHFYQKSKPDVVVRESYSDNLKDPSDDALRRIAQRMLDKLGGTAVGSVVVRMGTENGEVIIDGDKRVPLQSGTARLELSAGSHSVEVAVTGQGSQKRNVLITPGKETVVDLSMTSTPVVEKPKQESSFPTRKVVGGTLMAGGIGAGVVSVVFLLKYLDAQDRGEEAEANSKTNPGQYPPLPEGKRADDVCGQDSRFTDKEAICKANQDANASSTVAWVTGIGGGVLLLAGAYFLFTDSGKEKSTAKTRLTPTFGRGSGGLMLSGSF